jgi:hypothetical protein
MSENSGSYTYQLKKLHMLVPLTVFQALVDSGHLYTDLDVFGAKALAKALQEEGYLSGSAKKHQKKKVSVGVEAV